MKLMNIFLACALTLGTTFNMRAEGDQLLRNGLLAFGAAKTTLFFGACTLAAAFVNGCIGTMMMQEKENNQKKFTYTEISILFGIPTTCGIATLISGYFALKHSARFASALLKK